MHIGLVGLGRMGNNMRTRLRAAGIEVTGYDPNPKVTDVADLGALAEALPAPRIVWVMVPSGPITTGVITDLAAVLSEGDLVIEGGNSKFTEDAKHAELLGKNGIRYVDCGVSGGIWGAQNGYGLMAGGDKADIERAMPVFDALRPDGPREEGFVHAGAIGAGHYAKMVHNGIEYGIMASLAEGLNLLEHADAGVEQASHSAEVAPLEEPEFYQFTIDTPKVAELWRRGSVISSWLLDLTAAALEQNPTLDGLAGRVSDSGEGRWTVKAAVDVGVPVPVLAASLFERFASRDEDHYANQLLSAMRLQFGGHQELPAGDVLEAGSRKADSN